VSLSDIIAFSLAQIPVAVVAVTQVITDHLQRMESIRWTGDRGRVAAPPKDKTPAPSQEAP
jgi:hypothetical protein